MGTMCQLAVLDPQRRHVRDGALIDVAVEDDLDWIASVGDWEMTGADVSALSKRLDTDVVLLAFQSASDSFLYRLSRARSACARFRQCTRDRARRRVLLGTPRLGSAERPRQRPAKRR